MKQSLRNPRPTLKLLNLFILSLGFSSPARAQDKCLAPAIQILRPSETSLTPEFAAQMIPQRIYVEPHEINGELLVNLRKAAILEAKANLKAAASETPIRDVGSPTLVRYIIDAEGKLYWIEGEGRPHSSDQLYAGKEGSARSHIPVMETGRLHYDPATKKWKLDADWSSGLKPQEVTLALAEVEEIAKEGSERPTREVNPGKQDPSRLNASETEKYAKKLVKKKLDEEHLSKRNLKETVLNCADIMEGQLAGKGALANRIAMDVLTSAIVGGVKQATGSADYLGLHADTDEKRARVRMNRQVLAADTLGNIAGSVVSNGLDKALVNSAAGNVQQFMIRAGARYLVGVQGQRLISGQIIDDLPAGPGGSVKNTAQDLTRFNNAWFAFRIATDPFVSKFISSDLPGYAFNACKSGSILRVVLSPGVVRIVERTATTTLYFGLRSHFTGN